MKNLNVYRLCRTLIFYISMVLLAAFSVYLLVMGAFVWFNGGCTAFDEMHVILRGPCMLAIVLLLFLLFGFFSRKLSGFSEQKLKRITLISGAVFFALQMSFVILARAGIRYDSLKVVDEAIALFSQKGILETDLDGYFARYANNYAMTIMTHWIIKLLRAVGLIQSDFSNAVLVLQFINVLFVDTAFAGCYVFLNKYFGRARAVCFLLYMAWNPLSYVWLPFYYTNTCSMAFAVWGIYFLFAAFDLKKPRSAIYMTIAGVLFYSGYKIRATVMIALIAGLLGQLYRRGSSVIPMPAQKTPEPETSGQKKSMTVSYARKQAAAACILLLVLFLSMILTKVVYQPIEKHYLTFDAEETAFPITHWIAMGLAYYGDGSYNAEDEQITISYVTAEAKKAATTGLMLQRAKELGVSGVFSLYMKKLSNTFGDGAGGYHSELNLSRDYGLLWQIVYGVHRDPLLVITQCFYLLSILCTIFAILFLWQKKLPEEGFVLLLLLTGSYLFQMIWESATIYSIGTMYLNGCMVALGFSGPVSEALSKSDVISDSGSKTADLSKAPLKRKKSRKLIRLSMAVFGLAGLCGMIVRLAKTEYTEVSVSVDQFLFQAEEYPALSYGQKICQTFQSEKKFSTIAFQVRNYAGELNDSIYLVSLFDGDGTLLQKQKLVGSQTQDFGFCRLPFDSVPGIKDYEIRIEKKKGKEDLIFLYYDTGHYDTYPGGKMTGPVEGDMADLLFEVYDREEK